MLLHIDETRLQWVYAATATIGLLMALFLPSSAKTVPSGSRQTYAILQVLTLVGAIVGAKLAFLMGDLHWPSASVPLEQVIYSGRSITGGLLGGFVVAELAKIPLRWRELPNDWFAAKLPLSIAVGRVGCVLSGCCRGVAGDYPLAMIYSDGVRRFPAQLCELGFQLVAFAVAYALWRRRALRGRIFAVYMMSYGVFRFGLEALRETEKLSTFDGALSAYQLFALALAAAGLVSFLSTSRRLRAQPQTSPEPAGAG